MLADSNVAKMATPVDPTNEPLDREIKEALMAQLPDFETLDDIDSKYELETLGFTSAMIRAAIEQVAIAHHWRYELNSGDYLPMSLSTVVGIRVSLLIWNRGAEIEQAEE